MDSPSVNGVDRAVPPAEAGIRAGDRSRAVIGVSLAFLTAMAMLLTGFAASRAGYPGYSASRVAFWWLASLALLAGTSVWVDVHASRSRPTSMSPRLPRLRTIGLWIGMTLVAALPRLVMLDRFPTVLDADEAAFMVHALEFQNGEMPNPFATGYASNPLLLPAVQGIMASGFGDDISSYRLPGAVLGIVGVLGTWRLGARLCGEVTGAIAGLLLATWPLHLHLSRVALNNITDPAALAIGLLFTVRALDDRRAPNGVVAGVALGMALYGYYGGRVLWIVVLAVLVGLAIVGAVPHARVFHTGIWAMAGFVAAAIPILVAFWQNPAEFGGHLDLISTITPDAFRDDPAGTARLLVGNVLDTIVYPVAGNNLGFFRHEPPFIGWPLTVLVITGFAVLLFDGARRRDPRRTIPILLPYLLLAGGIALTIPISGQRYGAATPLLAILAGGGLVALVRMAAHALSVHDATVRIVVTVCLALALGATNLRWMASEDRQLETYGDLRTTMMWDMGWRIREGDGGVSRLLLAGAPFVFANGFPNLAFLTPGLVQEDVPGPILADSSASPLPEDVILMLVPERQGERCALKRAYPHAALVEAHARDGSLLYIALLPGEVSVLAAEDTPAETTLRLVSDSPCVPDNEMASRPNTSVSSLCVVKQSSMDAPGHNVR